jgi:hypothetical protein
MVGIDTFVAVVVLVVVRLQRVYLVAGVVDCVSPS